MDDLLKVARQYEREAHRPFTPRRLREARQQDAALLRRMVSNREAAHPDRLNPARAALFDVIERWCRERGYRCSFGIHGMTVQRGTEPPITVGFYDTLAWDGHNITVADPERLRP